MTQKHTPGPWELIEEENRFPSVLIGQRGIPYADGSGNYDRCGQITINGASPGGPMELHVANARLIAAAPDLLAALIRMVAQYGHLDYGNLHPDTAVNHARAAIAKAGV